MLRMLALTVRPVLAPDTRYRLLQYKDRFNNQGIELIHRALYPPVYYQMLAGAGTLRKGIGLLSSLPGRLADIVGRSRDYDVVWVGRELFPVGPALLEKMLFSRHPNVILDIDDALFLADPACTGFVHRKLRRFDKFEEIAHGFKAIVCGNRFLANYFERLSPSVHVIPTVVEAARYADLKRPANRTPCIGWIGTPTNRVHLDQLRIPLTNLARRYDFRFRIVGLSQRLDWDIHNMEYRDWSLERELDFFTGFDIGVMPLQDSLFTRGKCAFKLIQYMAAGVPVVASPVGSNQTVVEDGVNGLLAESPQEWEHALEILLADSGLRERMGEYGREIVREKFSLERYAEPYADIIRRCA